MESILLIENEINELIPKKEEKTFSYSQNKNITPKLSKTKRNINLYEKYKKYMNYSSSKENKKITLFNSFYRKRK